MMSKGFRSLTSQLTLRVQCRKCDRGQPSCRRCATKGFVCGGYPPKYKFIGVASRGKWKGLREPLPMPRLDGEVQIDIAVEASDSSGISPEKGQEFTGSTTMSPSDVSFLDSITTTSASPSNVASEDIERVLEDDIMAEEHEVYAGIEELLAADRTEILLSYCKLEKIFTTTQILTHVDDLHVCPTIAIIQPGLSNPFREHVVSKILPASDLF